MDGLTRREFLKLLGTASAVLIATRVGVPAAASDGQAAYEFLVVGDSIVWGQGLDEKDKFYSLTADWLRSEAFGGRRDVALKVKAHSGSTLKFHPEEAAKYKAAGRDETFYYPPEVNVGFPSTWKQIEVASAEYSSAGKPDGAELIMLTGGITDISVEKVLDPNGDNNKLPQLIERYCRDDMYDVLEHAATLHPKALIAVVGYFPMLSNKTSGKRLFNSWLETMSFPRALKSFVNNGLIRPLLFRKLQKKAITRSRIWYEESNKGLSAAVDKLNAKFAKPRAVFIRSPITEDTCLETPNTLLFRMGPKGATKDPLYSTRSADCRRDLPDLKRSTGIDYPVRLCEVAAIGHPDPAGSRAYAEAIKSVLAPVIR